MNKELCIYCKESKAPEEFNKEHVMPQAFGKFKGNLTLVNAVCSKCNEYFSKELELFLARDSLWGLMRYQYNLEPFSKEKWKKVARIRMTIDDPRLEEWNGAIVELAPPTSKEDNNPSIVPVAQVAFFIKGSQQKIHFALDRVPSKEECEKQNLDLSKHIVLGNSDKDVEQAKSQIEKRGISVKWEESSVINIPGPKILEKIRVSVKTRIDTEILRAAAKIGFNYLAYVHGRSFALKPCFDQIREFIRHEKHINKGLAKVSEGQLLRSRNTVKDGLKGHAIILKWKDQKLSSILCHVSVFNYLIFTIALCRSYGGVIRPISSCHLYDLMSKEVRKLTRLSIIYP